VQVQYSSIIFPLHNSKQHLQPTPKCLYGGAVVQIYYLYIEQVAQTIMAGHNEYKVMANNVNPKTDPSQPMVYQIRIKGHLGCQWTDWFGGLTITLEDNGETLLTGPVIDQAALYGLLKKVRNLGMPLLSVSPVEPSQPDVSEVKPRNSSISFEKEKSK
jgi:hypothetical protein